jgi:NAD(P)-dependent dehydrogenase (short-subunit alcohol dehydrogenase family)
VLLVGGSRGLGLALAGEWARGGRPVVATVRGPLRVIEALQDRVEPAGTIGVMSSGQGSVANNERGGHEVYRGSKAALNTFMRSYAARRAGLWSSWPPAGCAPNSAA